MADDGGAALVHPDTKLSHALNSTGALIWKFLEKGCTVDEIAEKLRDTFDIAPEIARKDAAAFTEEMLASGLIAAAE